MQAIGLVLVRSQGDLYVALTFVCTTGLLLGGAMLACVLSPMGHFLFGVLHGTTDRIAQAGGVVCRG